MSVEVFNGNIGTKKAKIKIESSCLLSLDDYIKDISKLKFQNNSLSQSHGKI